MAEIYKSNAINTDNNSTKIICPVCKSSYIEASINKTTNRKCSICLNCGYIFYNPISIRDYWLLYKN